jgi:ubiquitin-like modifier-activating enzyme ATG7
MDQQCTVTRPSVSSISSALAVELIVAMLHEPSGASAAHEDVEHGAPSWEAGPLPHMVRGFGAGFTTMSMCGSAFPSCTACGCKVRQAAMDGGDDFLLRVFNDPLLLGQVSGIAKMVAAADDVDVDWSDDDGSKGDD